MPLRRASAATAVGDCSFVSMSGRWGAADAGLRARVARSALTFARPEEAARFLEAGADS
jgi:hypothetical protein